MIIINKYPEQRVQHYDINDELIGDLNELESIDLRCQIAEQGLEGFYIIYHSDSPESGKIRITIPINKFGAIVEWPNGLYDVSSKLYSRLFIAQQKARKNEIQDTKTKSKVKTTV